MFMPTQFVELYDNKLIDYSHSPGNFSETYCDLSAYFPKCSYELQELRKLFEDPESVTKEQWTPYWERIVEVFSVIKSNPDNFDMATWHCGTTHCMAGWVQFLYTNGTDNETCGYVGEEYLSPLMRPFFHLVSIMTNPLSSEYDGEEWILRVENVIMEHLIDPVLEEARKDGLLPIVTQTAQLV